MKQHQDLNTRYSVVKVGENINSRSRGFNLPLKEKIEEIEADEIPTEYRNMAYQAYRELILPVDVVTRVRYEIEHFRQYTNSRSY